ncbi:hypothetical protein BDQ17DRAFT_891474 [Cyathus striatus]|nr:hypothetical protein BDQ17DRAFT_985727 [Cyathus striatus]KAF8997099.1 hypothetical protein BDQ17DRAFT_891474 [Cyathus striatus]
MGVVWSSTSNLNVNIWLCSRRGAGKGKGYGEVVAGLEVAAAAVSLHDSSRGTRFVSAWLSSSLWAVSKFRVNVLDTHLHPRWQLQLCTSCRRLSLCTHGSSPVCSRIADDGVRSGCGRDYVAGDILRGTR